MITSPDRNHAAPEVEAGKIAGASDEEARDFVSRGIRERWLSTVVGSLNGLER